MDVQGLKAAKPWWDKAKTTFPCLVDSENIIGTKYNIKAVPWGFLVNEKGELVWGPAHINPSKKELIEQIAEWIDKGDSAKIVQSAQISISPVSPKLEESQLRFNLGVNLYNQGKKEEAIVEWRKALELDPDSWIIHKQIWAVEHPDKFYNGDVDFAWQKEILKQGK